MEILDSKTDKELIQSIIAEIAKTSNEIKCAKNDLEKAQSRLSFVLAVANTLINRKED